MVGWFDEWICILDKLVGCVGDLVKLLTELFGGFLSGFEAGDWLDEGMSDRLIEWLDGLIECIEWLAWLNDWLSGSSSTIDWSTDGVGKTPNLAKYIDIFITM